LWYALTGGSTKAKRVAAAPKDSESKELMFVIVCLSFLTSQFVVAEVADGVHSQDTRNTPQRSAAGKKRMNMDM
jgi:hypothetical protein